MSSPFIRFLDRHKLAIFNLLLALFMFILPLRSFRITTNLQDFYFYLATAMIAGLFLEFLAIDYKAIFIFRKDEFREVKIPLILQLAFFPRILVSLGIITLVANGLGWLNQSDFILLAIVTYAFGFEFWVRSTLHNPEYAEGKKVNPARIWTGEIFHFYYTLCAYFCMWQLFLLDTPRLLNKMRYPQNYPLFILLFFVGMLAIQLPYLTEAVFRTRKTGGHWTFLLSFIAPILAFVYDMIMAARGLPG